MNALYRIVQIAILLIGVWGCSSDRAGHTTSKIKIIGANAFSGSLGTVANNGLILYGRSLDGKSFSKKINSDVLDLNFPNGTWNFYAVAWNHGTPTLDTGLMGKVSCAKALGIQLKGVEVAINLKLNNNNCDGNFHPNVEFVSTENKLGSLSLFSCKNFSGVSSYASTNSTFCDQTTAFPNKGYATSFRLVVPEYSSFGGLGGPAITSNCMEVQSSVTTANLSTGGLAIASDLNFPRIGLNGFEAFIKVYYSETPCDESLGFTTISLSQSSKKKHFVSAPIAGVQIKDQYFLETDAAVICQEPRNLISTTFASGIGTADLPYTICTRQQFLNIEANFTSGLNVSTKSFDLLNNIDFNFQPITATGGDGSSPYTGTFNGRNHRIENFRIDCDGLGSSNNFALFRYAYGARFSNLVINRAVIECDVESQVNNNIGILLGKGSLIDFTNIRAFGHVEGKFNVGGIAGQVTLNSHVKDVHFEGDVKGEGSIGGLLGLAEGTSDATPLVFQSSFHGSLRGKCPGDSCDSMIGGLVGFADYTSSGIIDQSTAKIKSASGSRMIGGLIGRTSYIKIYNSIVSGLLVSDAPAFSQVGGLVGTSSFGEFLRNIAYVTRKIKATDLFDGGIIGKSLNLTNCISGIDRNYGFSSNYSNTCNTNALFTLSTITDALTYTAGDFSTDFPLWSWPVADRGAGRDIPRLAWEISRESSVPYLKRKCSGLYDVGSQSGDGSSLNPISICNMSQFDSMASGVYYELKKDLVFNPLTPITQKTSGDYFLDGNKYSFYGPYIETISIGNHGIFKQLNQNSEIKNLNIFNAKIGGMVTVPGSVSVGMLAGKNSGVISNVNIFESSTSFNNLDFESGSQAFNIGGIVGVNENSGIISNLEIDNDIKFLSALTNGDDVFRVASVVANNLGVIKLVKSSGSINRSMAKTYIGTAFNSGTNNVCGAEGDYSFDIDTGSYYSCVAGTYTQRVSRLSLDDNFAGVVAYNTGTLTEIDFDGDVTILDDPANSAGLVAPFIGDNHGTVSDINIRGRMSLTYRPVKKVIQSNSGSVSRLYFNPKTSTAFDFTGLDLFFTAGDDSPGICHSVAVGNCTAMATSITDNNPYFYLDGNLFSTWSFSNNFFAPTNTTWLLEDGELTLRRTGGNFEKLGKGF